MLFCRTFLAEGFGNAEFFRKECIFSEEGPSVRALPAEKKTDIVFGATAFCVVMFLLWKVQFGFANIDESFYLTVPMRLWMGDGLFVHEWNLSQMSSVLLYPFVAGFMEIHGGDVSGILLAFRYLCVAVHTVATVILYRRLRAWNPIGAAAGTLFFLIYSPFGITALSYNSMGIDALALACVLYCTGEGSKRWRANVISGIFLGCAVLCCPYLLLVYVYFSAAVLFRFFYRKEKRFGQDWLAVTAGAAAAATVFLALVFYRASVGDILNSLEPMLNDPQHVSVGIAQLCMGYFRAVCYSAGLLSRTLFIGIALVFVLTLLDRKRKFSPYLLVCNFLLTACLLAVYYKVLDFLNFLMFPLNVCAFCCWPMAKNGRVSKLFWTVWVPGMLYSFCIHCASNQALYAITSASTVALIGSVPMIILTVQDVAAGLPEKCAWRKMICLGAACLLAMQLSTELIIRYRALYWEAPMYEQTCKIESGPGKGIRVSPAYAQDYLLLDKAVTESEAYRNAKSVLFLSEKTWLYLLEPKQIASYSAWLSGVSEASIERLALYYGLHPDKKPDCIFLPDDRENYLPLVKEKLVSDDIPVVLIPAGKNPFPWEDQ